MQGAVPFRWRRIPSSIPAIIPRIGSCLPLKWILNSAPGRWGIVSHPHQTHASTLACGAWPGLPIVVCKDVCSERMSHERPRDNRSNWKLGGPLRRGPWISASTRVPMFCFEGMVHSFRVNSRPITPLLELTWYNTVGRKQCISLPANVKLARTPVAAHSCVEFVSCSFGISEIRRCAPALDPPFLNLYNNSDVFKPQVAPY